jgi:hypothetical protein
MKIDAILGVGRILYVCITLTFGAVIFSKDADDLVLLPLEKMI